MLFDHNCSTVSMCSGRHCGIECGQKILPINGNSAAYEEYFYCVYVTLQNRKSQVIFSVPAIQILDSIKQGKGGFVLCIQNGYNRNIDIVWIFDIINT